MRSKSVYSPNSAGVDTAAAATGAAAAAGTAGAAITRSFLRIWKKINNLIKIQPKLAFFVALILKKIQI